MPTLFLIPLWQQQLVGDKRNTQSYNLINYYICNQKNMQYISGAVQLNHEETQKLKNGIYRPL